MNLRNPKYIINNMYEVNVSKSHKCKLGFNLQASNCLYVVYMYRTNK